MKLLHKIWLYIRWPLAILVVFYILLVLYRIPAVGEQQKTDETITKIQSQHITLSDVNGDIMPPVPNKEENDATVAGIDKNNNGIRDDVELAIFKLHPDSAKIRAAELQYAMAEQMFLTDVFNTDTWKEVSIQDDRGYQCVASTSSRNDLQKHTENTEALTKEIQDLIFNTKIRTDAKEKAFNFTTSSGLRDTNVCDIDINTLSS